MATILTHPVDVVEVNREREKMGINSQLRLHISPA